MTKKILELYLNFYPLKGVSFKRRIAIHLLFWFIVVLFFYLVNFRDVHIEITMMVLGLILRKALIIYYGLTYIALPKLFSKNQSILGIVLIILIYVINYWDSYLFYAVAIENIHFQDLPKWYKYAQTYIASGYEGMWKPVNFFYELQRIVSDVGIAFVLKFGRLTTKNSVTAYELKNENSKIEIAFLRDQLNPHFLLNSLNNIYSQVISNDEDSKKSITVLSDLMNYIFYNSGETLVDLEREIQFLTDYIGLEKLKGNKYLNIQFNKEGNMSGYKIAPLILINYVENSFKHASSPDGTVANIDINIKFSEEILIVKIENDYIEKIKINTNEGGVGLENTRKRLLLLYPENHGVKIDKEKNKFLVELWLKLKRE